MVYSGVVLTYDSWDVYSWDTAIDTTLNFYGWLYVSRGGTANSTTVNSDGWLYVESGGTANSNTVNAGGNMTVSYGGIASSNTVNAGGNMTVSYGGIASSNTVNAGGNLTVLSGGTAAQITENGGYVNVEDGANVTFVPTVLSGLTLYGGATVHSGTTASSNTVNAGGNLTVLSGGTANSTTVNSYGWLYVSRGGTANSATVNSGGSLTVSSGGTADSTTVNWGGTLVVDDGGTATIAFNPWIGSVYASAGAVVTYLERDAAVYYGGTADGLLDKGDVLTMSITSRQVGLVYSGGTANATTVNSGGSLTVSSGGTVCGLQIANGAEVSAYAGAEVRFDLTARTTADAALVNDLSLVRGTPDFSITVSATQAYGKYKLADGAAGFDKTVTVRTADGGTIGAITVGGMDYLSGRSFSINLENGQLSLLIARGQYWLTSGTSIAAGDMGQTQTQVLIGASTFSNFVVADDCDWHVEQKLLLKEVGVTAGGRLVLTGSASATILNDRGFVDVGSSANVRSVTVFGDGELNVDGGLAAMVTVSDGGVENLVNGGSALRTAVYGAQRILSGGTANSTTVFAGGVQSVEIAGLAKSDTISSGGSQVVSGGSSYRAAILPGGSQIVSSGGTATEAAVTAGFQFVHDGGLAESTTVDNGSQYLSFGGVAKETMISGVLTTRSATLTSTYQYAGDRIYWTRNGDRTEVISSSWAAAMTSSTKVYYYDYTGSQFVSSGGVAYDTQLGSGAIQTVFAGGVASDTTVESGAFQYVLKDGSAFGTEVFSGGIVAVEYDGYGENVAVRDGGSIAVHGTVKNLTVARNAAYYFDMGTAVFQGDLDCYLNPDEMEQLNEILTFSELDSLTLRVNASTFGQDRYNAFSTEYNSSLDYRSMLVLDDGKAVSLRDDSRYWYNGELYHLAYDSFEHQYLLQKSTQEKTLVLLSAAENIDVLEASREKVIWRQNAYQDYGEVIAVQETSAEKNVYLNTDITVSGMLQSAVAVDFVRGGTLQLGANDFAVNLVSNDETEAVLCAVHNAAVIRRRLPSLPAVPAAVSMCISATADHGSAVAAGFLNESSDMVFSGGIAGDIDLSAVGENAYAQGIVAVGGATTVTEPVSHTMNVLANATGGSAFALGAGLLFADELDMTWRVNAQAARGDAAALGAAVSRCDQFTSSAMLQVSASAGGSAYAGGFIRADQMNSYPAAAELAASELFAGQVIVSASGNVASAVGVETALTLAGGVIMEADISASANGNDSATAVGVAAFTGPVLSGGISAYAQAEYDVSADGIMLLNTPRANGKIEVSAKSQSGDVIARGLLGSAGVLSGALSVSADGFNSVRAFGTTDNEASPAPPGGIGEIAADGLVDIRARSRNQNTRHMAPVYAIGARVDQAVHGCVCVSAHSTNQEQETLAAAVYGRTLTIDGIVGASAATRAAAVTANDETTRLDLTVSGVIFAGNFNAGSDNTQMIRSLRAITVGSDVSAFCTAKDMATADAYAFYAYDKDDSITIDAGAMVFGDAELAGGSNTVSISNGAFYYGNINASYGTLSVEVILDSMRTDRAVIIGDIQSDATLSVDISSIKSDGRYTLLSGSATASTLSALTVTYFGGSSTLNVDAADYTEIRNYGRYRCRRIDNDLVFEVADIVKRDIFITSSVPANTMTNENIELSAEFSSTATITARQYKINNGMWNDYTGSVTVTENSTVTFRMIDDSSLEFIEQYTVTNIDKVAPVIDSIRPSTTEETDQPVKVSAEFSDNIALKSKQYRIGTGGAWQDYVGSFDVSQNAVVYFRAVDTAGNETIKDIVIGNINTLLPTITLSGNTIDFVQSAVLSAASDSGNTIYYNTVSADYNGSWSVYSSPISVTANGTYFFKTTDNAGNTGTASITFANIQMAQDDLIAGDLNADGRADIVMTITQTTHPYCGATGAWLIGQDQIPVWGDLSTRNAGWEIFGTGRTTAGKATADVYVRSTGNVIGAWTTGDDGRVNGWETIGEFSSDTEIVGLGDFNGNGQTDLLLRNKNGAVGCHFTGGERTGWNYFQSLGNEWKLSAIGDLNGDGRDDVVLKHDAGFAGSWLTQADGTMAWADLDTLPKGFAIVGSGDFDGDGTDDVLLQKGSYFGAWLVRDGNAARWFGIGDLGDATVEQIADFDGDGVDDLRVRTSDGNIGANLVRGEDALEWKYYGGVGDEWSTALAAL